ncbi:PIG-L family deacetylase [Aliivibrio fischeri]|uniref:PIG-L family deacetylase n=1 Tax=Aliivibrio fischeri TaxID=668 RepID=UPI0012D8921C|nr:PIG-L family deacetylase [Aliivibrio fischeri]MUK26544.1 hypothetical protein [Aliivibrio fischeri]MUK33694.1 hypothetical protein [Aliivibrio fischeri]
MKEVNYEYPLKATWECSVNISNSGFLECDNQDSCVIEHHSILLRFSYTSLSKKKLGVISVNEHAFSTKQYFEAGQKGIRYLNITGIKNLKDISITYENCDISIENQLLGFKNPDLASGPILIIAPHADDAELSAYGLYSDHASNTWIATINTGSNLQGLERQYIQNLDTDIALAEKRKGYIRSWNAMTTPLLAKVPMQQLLSLGYFNISSSSVLNTPKDIVSHPSISDISPNNFRQWNHVKLSNDTHNINSGAALIQDLVELIEHIQPRTILVTHPEIDPHDEHVASAIALHLALQKSTFIPENILFYVNHLRGIKLFPYGPEHSRTALPPWFKNSSLLDDSSCYSHTLSYSKQQEKVLAFDTMHDLRSKDRLEKKLKRWINQKIKKNGYQYYGNHSYFQTHIKADEVFITISGNTFKNKKFY